MPPSVMQALFRPLSLHWTDYFHLLTFHLKFPLNPFRISIGDERYSTLVSIKFRFVVYTS